MKTNKDMTSEIISAVALYEKKSVRNKKLTITLISVISILLCLGTGVTAAVYRYPIFSESWINNLKEKAEHAVGLEEAEEFRSRMSMTDDIFSSNAKETHFEVIMDYDNSVPVNLTQQNGSLTYNFKTITPGEFLTLSLIKGSLADSDAEFGYKILKRYYAIIEISRTDKAPLKEEDIMSYQYIRFASGYNPFTMNLCLQSNGAVQIFTDHTMHCAIDITDLLIFADNDLFITLADMEAVFDIYEHIYANKKGDIILKDNAPDNTVMFRFTHGKDFADKSAVRQYLKKNTLIDKNFDGYTK